MPFNLSFTHLAVVGIVALVVLGPERLPGVARNAGALWKEWQRIRGNLEGEVREVLSEFREPFEGPITDIRQSVTSLAKDVRGATAAPAITMLPPLGPGANSAPIPTLGEGTGLMSPGPDLHAEIPELAPPADPNTFVPYTPA